MPPKGSGRWARRPAVSDLPKEDRPVIAPEPTLEPASLPPEPKADRVSVSLKPDGTVDWDSMRPSTQDRVRRAFGASEPGTAPVIDAVSPMLVRALVGSISTLAVGIARATGHTAPSSEAMRLTDKDIEELIPLWTAAINDYGLFLGRHQNLIVAGAATGLAFLPRVQGLERAARPTGTVKSSVQ